MNNLHIHLRKYLKPVLSLREGEQILLFSLNRFRQQLEMPQIAFVSGILTSDGSDMIAFHRRSLRSYVHLLSHQLQIPVFCCQDVFSPRQEALFHQSGTRYPEWVRFWRRILSSGSIDRMYFTPGWRRSRGALDEYRTARKRGLKIYEIEPSEDYRKQLIILPK